MFSIKFRFIRKISRFVVIHRRNSSINEKIHNNLLPETESQRILKVAIIGMPNAGKSTFINNLMDRKVCPTSSKVHTTRNKSCAIFTEGDAQIVFVDTPGLVNDRELKKYKLAPSFMHDSRTSMDATDMIGVIHDVDNSYMREKLDIKIIKLLQKHEKKRSFLVLNKIDVLKSKRKLLDITRIITENCLKGQPIAEGNHKIELEQKGWRYFSDIFMVSALTGDGLTNVRNYLSQQALPGKWMFPEEVWTDQSPENIIVNTTKAILLNFLPQEMPYLLKVNIEYFEMNDDGVINTTVLVKCPSERIAKFIAGDQQGFLRKIIRTVQENLQNTFRNFVKINIVLDAPKKAEKTK